MGQHAKRFDATDAPKGSGQAAVTGALKGIADIVEERFDPNSPQVVSAMQRFEMGLNLLKGAPAHPETGEPRGEKAKTSGTASASTGRRRKSADPEKPDDTPGNGAEGSGAVESS